MILLNYLIIKAVRNRHLYPLQQKEIPLWQSIIIMVLIVIILIIIFFLPLIIDEIRLIKLTKHKDDDKE